MAGSRWRLCPTSGLYLAPTGTEVQVGAGVPALALPLPLLLTPLGAEVGAAAGTPIVDVPGTIPPWPNEPGYTLLSDVDAGASRPMPGWTVYQSSGNNAALVTDFVEDTVSPPNGLQVSIPAGFGGGGGPEHQELSVDAGNYSRLFFGCTFMLSPNFDATAQAGSSAPSGVQKLFHIWSYTNTGVQTMVVVSAFGTGTSFTFQLRNQNFDPTNSRGVSFNITGGGTALARGVVHKLEVLLQLNTGANADGLCRGWLNEVQRLNATGLIWNATGQKRFNRVQFNPTVQNTGWKSNVAQWIRLGHVYVSAAA